MVGTGTLVSVFDCLAFAFGVEVAAAEDGMGGAAADFFFFRDGRR